MLSTDCFMFSVCARSDISVRSYFVYLFTHP